MSTPIDQNTTALEELVEMAESLPESSGNGRDGATFMPSVSEDGTISWTNDKGLDNPAPVNLTTGLKVLADAELELLNTMLTKDTLICFPEMTATKWSGYLDETDPETGTRVYCRRVTANITNIDKAFVKKVEVATVRVYGTITEYEWHDAEIVFGETDHVASFEIKTTGFLIPYKGFVVKMTYYSLVGGVNEMTVEAVDVE